MTEAQRYTEAWEGFWGNTSDVPGEAIWDSDPALTAAPHLDLLQPYVADPGLPILDLGCGNGTQTRHLATRFPRALGVDLSHAAVELARRADRAGVARYEQLDLADAERVRALHERLGDGNVYMRAVIHQSRPEHRAPVAGAVAELIGTAGRAFVVELTPAAKEVLRDLAEQPGGPPEKLRRVFAHGLTPAEATDDEVPALLRSAGLELLAEGRTELVMTECRRDGTRIDLPARWFVAGRG
ncbi:class I SAM-dependent methyltransferase [Streptomyces sp. ISL-11]|uniref:class I SAM-dependent methyltransferase n=1 Tax=Streptomyces sp. ISL-11 TaxID=2819174 RepID=UPI001BE587D1|nr:class I SAM-dependent methyltransferase [Streptomyces sp. ISL-11]MBT2383409.1 methyltransferase domain-containing protein [Streptomyces sp. ISL-11]